MYRLLVAVIICLFLSGCASLNSGMDIKYDKEGRVINVETRGIQDLEVTKGDAKIHRRVAFELWPKELFTIYKD